jgi:hypothetical protein
MDEGVDQADEKQDRDASQQQTGKNGKESDDWYQPQRNPWMRCREFAGAALVADFGVAGVRMPRRAEFEIVRSSAEVAEQWFAGRDSVTLIAIAHESSFRKASGAGRRLA